jgi:site-specific DNA-methyltransferase (adenine-specific)
VWDDLGNFSTMSKERVKFANGKNLPYQKPFKMFDRLLLPFTDEGDFVLDLFAGSGSVGAWCKNNNRDYLGIEYNTEIYNIAKERLGL